MKSISGSARVGKRFGLGRDAIFRLWKAAIKDDEGLLERRSLPSSIVWSVLIPPVLRR